MMKMKTINDMNKNIVIVHYNTPYLTECLVRSINFFVKDAIIYIFDNSDKLPFTAKFDNVTIIDNTKGQIIDFGTWLEKYPDRIKSSAFRNNYGSAKHCYSIDKCMDIINDNFLLLDSDILLKKDISKLIDEKFVFVGGTEIWKARNPMPDSHPKAKIRAVPYMCYINTKLCKKYNIRYFNDKYMYGLSANGDSYDTGSYFFEQFIRKGLKWKKINYNEYIVHYKAATWVDSAKKYDNYNPISIEKWLEIHKNLWDFKTEVKKEKPIEVKKNSKKKKVVYTCITGDYDNLLTPKIVSEDFDYICFTDNTNLQNDVWKIMPLPKETDELSQVKKQRYVKTHPHLILKDYDISIWIDGNIEIIGEMNDFIKNVDVSDASILIPKHPSRKCIYAEERAVISMKKDTSQNTNPQIKRYKEEKFPKDYGLVQSNIIFRKHNDEKCIKIMDEWWEEIKNGSHRDQLSFNYVCWKNNDVKVVYLNEKTCESRWFRWKKMHNKFKKTPTIKRNIDRPRKSVEQLKADFDEIIRRRKKCKTGDISIYIPG